MKGFKTHLILAAVFVNLRTVIEVRPRTQHMC